jgi:serine phosphatase RsbU (regulator of sigma subunit)
MSFISTSFLRYLVYLWPLLLVYWLGQSTMRLIGNANELGITYILSVLDFIIFILFFSIAAWWAFQPLGICLHKVVRPKRHQKVIERVIADFPWRALKAYLITGVAFAAYLLATISLIAILGDYPFSLRMFVALALNICFGSLVLAPALAVAASFIYSSRLRMKLFKLGLFISQIGSIRTHKQITSASRRPWLILIITSLLPTLILSIYVYLALAAGSEVEERFILSQALVLLVMSVTASLILVWMMSNTLKKVTGTLEIGLQQIASGQFEERVPVLLDDDLGDLARGLNTAMEGLLERDDLKDSLAIAAEIQQGLMPRFAPVIPNYHLKGFQQTCYAVGGDYYDYIKLQDGRVWLIVADVSGKGYPAALTMANLQAMLRGLAIIDWPIEEATNYLNDSLCDTLTAGNFVTLFMAKLQPKTNSMVWVNAGHVPPMLMTKDGIKMLPASAPPLGMVKGNVYEIKRTDIAPGDTLLAYTDGVTETTNRSGKQMFGEARLKKWFEVNQSKSLEALPSELMQELNNFGRDGHGDDLTLLCVRREKS